MIALGKFYLQVFTINDLKCYKSDYCCPVKLFQTK